MLLFDQPVMRFAAVLVGALLSLFGASTLQDRYAFSKIAEFRDAEVVSVQRSERRSRLTGRTRVRFHLNVTIDLKGGEKIGAQVLGVSKDYDLPKGSRIRVLYAPGHRTLVENRLTMWFGPLAIFLMGAALFAVGSRKWLAAGFANGFRLR